MLKELQVKNFAIIDDVRINFDKGLNILTGETGAGKTLIIEAINLLMGERADNSLIREGEERLLVQGYFDFSDNKAIIDYLVRENLIEEGDPCDDVVITREVSKKGKNRAFINGIFTQLVTLKNLSLLFIDIHGQYEHQYLLEPRTHIEVIDKLGKEEVERVKKEYLCALEKYESKKMEISALKKLQAEREKKLSELKYRLDEIEKMNIQENEEEVLENEKRILKNYEKIYGLSSECINIINGEEGKAYPLGNNIGLLEKNLVELSKIDSNFKKYSEEVSSFGILVEELSHYLNSYLADFDFSPQRLDWIEERLFRLSELKRKYNIELSSIKEYLERTKKEIESLEYLDDQIEEKEEELDQLKTKLIEKGLALSRLRERIICDLEEKVQKELLDLGFKSVVFKVQNRFIQGNDGLEINGKKVKFTSNGIDEIEFLISLNPGESEKPLRKIASGGEISRIMLALKAIIGEVDNISTMIFDEIDVGIGGETSKVVGEKLYKISSNRQVICITHLAPIACFSDLHLVIDKYVEGNRTKIMIKKLDSEDRIKEISRMLSGKSLSSISIMHAKELIEKCNEIKRNLQGGIRIGN